jgi:hypothetical protein
MQQFLAGIGERLLLTMLYVFTEAQPTRFLAHILVSVD